MRVLVTGCWGGIGAALCKLIPQLLDCQLIMTSSSSHKRETLEGYQNQFPRSNFHFYQCDLSIQSDYENTINEINHRYNGIDILINNAAVFLDRDLEGNYLNILQCNTEELKKTLAVNVVAPYALIAGFLPGMIHQNFGRIANISSGMSRHGEYSELAPMYRLSKRALNGITLSTAYLLKNTDVFCFSVCPGWVKTSMGGKNARREPLYGALSIMASVLAINPICNGKFFRDGEQLSYESTADLDYYDLNPLENLFEKVKELADDFNQKYKK